MLSEKNCGHQGRFIRLRSRGFTLLELMIAVAIIGILAAIALPSYQESVRKGHRAAAQGFLMDAAQRQQQYLLDNRSFAGTLTAMNMSVPDEVSSFYTITIALSAGPPLAYTMTATPKSGTMQAADVTLTLNSAGVRTPADKW